MSQHGWSLLNVLRAKAHHRQGRGAAGPVRRAGGGGRGSGGGSRTAAAGGVERGVDGGQLGLGANVGSLAGVEY